MAEFNAPVFVNIDKQPEELLPSRYSDIELVTSVSNKIYKAYDNTSQQQVKITMVNGDIEQFKSDELEKKLIQISSFNHANILPIVDYDCSTQNYWVEPWFDGINIKSISTEQYSKKEIKHFITQLFELFIYIHQYQEIGGITFNDIIINDEHVKLSLSSSLIFSCDDNSQPLLSAPEQKSSHSYQSKSADVYILAEIITNIMNNNGVKQDKSLDGVIKKAKFNEPSKRYKSVEEFKVNFDKVYNVYAYQRYLSPKAIILSTMFIFFVGAIIVLRDDAAELVDEYRPLSQDEIIEQEQELLASFDILKAKISDFKKRYQSVTTELAKINQLSEQNTDQTARRVVLQKLERQFDQVLPKQKYIELNAKAKAIESLIKKGEFVRAKTKTDTLSLSVSQAYELSIYGERIIELESKLSTLQQLHPKRLNTAEFNNTKADIAYLLKNHRYEEALQEKLEPLIANFENKITGTLTAIKEALLNSIEASMVTIEPKKYKMGIQKAGMQDARPVHTVTLTGFMISKFEITNGQYNTYLDLTRQKHNNSSNALKNNAKKPVTNISWLQVNEFIKWLSAAANKRYRLPTEAEWEYAAKGNTTQYYPWGNGIGTDNANCKECYSSTAINKALPVGSFKSNSLGLFDMHGNVWEWLQDCYTDNYKYTPIDGTAYEFDNCKRRVVRGGAYNSTAKELISSYRNAALTNHTSNSIGFRVVQN